MPWRTQSIRPPLGDAARRSLRAILPRDRRETEPPRDAAPQTAPRADISRRATIVHVMPWPLTAGGAQRFFVDLATAQAAYADVHAICPEGGNFWDSLLAGVTIHAIARDASGAVLLNELAPDLVHHHHPSGGWLLDAARRTGAAILGTQHRWRENVDPARAAEVTPVCGPGPGVIRHGVDLEAYRPAPRLERPSPPAPIRANLICPWFAIRRSGPAACLGV